MPGQWRQRLIGFQAGYYCLTGVWPLLHMASFEAVTGPKVDDWLVKMVGLLAAVIGATLGVAVKNDRGYVLDIVVLAAGAAMAFAGIDLWYGLNGRISRIYLADATLELALLAGLVGTRRGAAG
ncbi:MAG TPA: hypothetical protein VH680_08675 [Gemmatimonadales bacterium]|jgi:hypothetical protein